MAALMAAASNKAAYNIRLKNKARNKRSNVNIDEANESCVIMRNNQ